MNRLDVYLRGCLWSSAIVWVSSRRGIPQASALKEVLSNRDAALIQYQRAAAAVESRAIERQKFHEAQARFSTSFEEARFQRAPDEPRRDMLF